MLPTRSLLSIGLAALLPTLACEDDDKPSQSQDTTADVTGGDTGPAGDTADTAAADPASPQTFCEAMCAGDERCDAAGTPATCVGDCVAEPPEDHLERYLPAFLVAFETCLRDRDCSKSQETCLVPAYAVVAPDVTTTAIFQTCMARRTACNDEWSDDTCYELTAYLASYQTQAEQCLGGECLSVSDCLDAL